MKQNHTSTMLLYTAYLDIILFHLKTKGNISDEAPFELGLAE